MGNILKKLTLADAKQIGIDLGIDWNEINLEVFTMGLNVEFEHGNWTWLKLKITHIQYNTKEMPMANKELR